MNGLGNTQGIYYETCSHTPHSWGWIISIGQWNGGIQIVHSTNKNMFVRFKDNTGWYDWHKIF